MESWQLVGWLLGVDLSVDYDCLLHEGWAVDEEKSCVDYVEIDLADLVDDEGTELPYVVMHKESVAAAAAAVEHDAVYDSVAAVVDHIEVGVEELYVVSYETGEYQLQFPYWQLSWLRCWSC